MTNPMIPATIISEDKLAEQSFLPAFFFKDPDDTTSPKEVTDDIYKLLMYLFRSMGQGVVKIEVTPQQAYERIWDSLQFFYEFNNKFTERFFIPRLITSEEVHANLRDRSVGLLIDDNDITEVTQVVPLGAFGNGVGIFNIQYQVTAEEFTYKYKNASNSGLAAYAVAREYLSLIDNLLNPETEADYNVYTRMLRLFQMDWRKFTGNNYLVLDALKRVSNERAFNDRAFKEFAGYMIKKQWGDNLAKHDGTQLIGGVVLQGRAIADEANTRLEALREEIKRTYEGAFGVFIA